MFGGVSAFFYCFGGRSTSSIPGVVTDESFVNFQSFVECVGHVALVSHAMPYLHKQFPLPHQQVDNLIRWMKSAPKLVVRHTLCCGRVGARRVALASAAGVCVCVDAQCACGITGACWWVFSYRMDGDCACEV